LKTPWIGGFLLLLILSACSGTPVEEGNISQTPDVPAPAKTSPTPVTLTAPSQTPDPTELPATDSSADNKTLVACQEESGSVQPFEIFWKDQEITGRIYTPPCYGKNPDLEYPTLYLLHGATVTDEQWDDLGVDEVADYLINEGQIPPLIIIMPREITWIALPENQFGENLVNVIIPWVNQGYQALEGRQYRAIGGLSRGGNWAARLGLLHWGLFGSFGAHSTPLFLTDLKRVPGWIEIIPSSMVPRIYLDIGDGDNNLAEAEAFRDSLTKLDIPHEWYLNPGLHVETYWKSHMEEYLLWYSAGWEDHLSTQE